MSSPPCFLDGNGKKGKKEKAEKGGRGNIRREGPLSEKDCSLQGRDITASTQNTAPCFLAGNGFSNHPQGREGEIEGPGRQGGICEKKGILK